jgi:poly(3-hydroxybutyrate) depolymerase
MMQISRIGSQLSVPIKRGMGMRARALLGLSTFLFACGTDNGDPMTSDGSMPSGPASSTTTESSGTESSSPSGSGDSSATPGMAAAAPPGMAAAAPPGMGEATPGMGTELVGVDGPGEGGGSTATGTGDGPAEDPAGSEGDTVTVSAGCGTTRELMNGRRTIQSGGMNREYILRVPDDYDNTRPYRLILAYHWANGTANQVANGGMGGSTEDPYYGLWDLAENSTIFVAPDGLPQPPQFATGWQNPDGRDLTLTDAILEEVMGDLCIDRTRIFATGFSYGAAMSHALACARADVFRGVALYAGATLSGCAGGTTPIAYFHAHGVEDSVLDFEMAGVPLRDRYVALNGCTPQNPPAPASFSGTHICTSYEGCSEGHPVRWCAHGGDHNPTEKDQGQSESWVPGEAWAFISQF